MRRVTAVTLFLDVRTFQVPGTATTLPEESSVAVLRAAIDSDPLGIAPTQVPDAMESDATVQTGGTATNPATATSQIATTAESAAEATEIATAPIAPAPTGTATTLPEESSVAVLRAAIDSDPLGIAPTQVPDAMESDATVQTGGTATNPATATSQIATTAESAAEATEIATAPIAPAPTGTATTLPEESSVAVRSVRRDKVLSAQGGHGTKVEDFGVDKTHRIRATVVLRAKDVTIRAANTIHKATAGVL